MATLKKFNLLGKQLGEIQAESELATSEVKSQSVKDYITALRRNARQWSASTRDRGEVAHSGKKPHRQKGTGRARQGSLAAPHFKGGGVAHGPKPKFDQHVRINKKERRQAIASLVAEKIRENRLVILDSTKQSEPKTKEVASFLKAVGFQGRTLILAEGAFEEIKTDKGTIRVSVASSQHQNFSKSIANLPKTNFSLVGNISGYDVMCAHDIVMTEAAYTEFVQWMAGTTSKSSN